MSTYKVEDMSCGHCVATIEKTVAATDPGARVTCDLPTRTIRLAGARDEAAIVAALGAAGYDSTPA